MDLIGGKPKRDADLEILCSSFPDGLDQCGAVQHLPLDETDRHAAIAIL